MAKQVSVSAAPTKKVMTFTFHWYVENVSQITNNGIQTKLVPECVNNVIMPGWDADVHLYFDNSGLLHFGIQLTGDLGINAEFKASLVDKENHKMMIYEAKRIYSGSVRSYAHSIVSKSFLSYKENGFITQNKLKCVIEVDCVVQSKVNLVQSSPRISLQHLRSGFTQLYDSKLCSDVTLNVGDSTFKAHKAILIASSPVFAAMFEHDMQEQKLNTITISDIDPEVIEGMLRFIYTGNIPDLDDIVEELLKAADKYAIPNLKLECVEYLLSTISIDNAAHTVMLADLYNAEDLKKKALDYITVNARDVVGKIDWRALLEGAGESAFAAEASEEDD